MNLLDSSIKLFFIANYILNGASWDDTYPHNTFIDLLNLAEKMLGGNTNRSIWIHGAYGTGKSKCAYTLKKILDVPEEEVRAYWDKFEPLKKNPVLLEKLIGHKSQGIVTAYRYASGSITTPQQLFFAVQESIKKALDEHGIAYKGEASLKESVIAWLEDPIHNQFMDALLQKPKWLSTFSQSTADEIRQSRDEIFVDRHEGTSLQLYISDVESVEDVHIVIDEKTYDGKAEDDSHFTFLMEDIKRAKTKPYNADVFDGSDLIGMISFRIKGKAATIKDPVYLAIAAFPACEGE